MSKTVDYKNKSFIFLPFKTNEEFHLLKTAVDSSPVWKDYDEDAKRYLLSYVADRIELNKAFAEEEKYGTKAEPICFVRKAEAKYISDANNKIAEIEKDKILKIENIILFCFDTTINFFCVEISFIDTDYEKITKELFKLKTFNDKRTEENDETKFKNEYHGILVDVAKLLFEEKVENYENKVIDNPLKSHFEVFTTTSSELQRANILTYYEAPLSLKDNPEKLNTCLFRLSHCYKKDFAYSADSDDKCNIYKNNDNCHWGCTSECAACIAYPEVKYVRDRFRESIDKGYLLTYALILNQKYKLYRIQTDLSRIVYPIKDEDKKKTEEICNHINITKEDFYHFERLFNFKTVSELPQYQNFYDLLYKENRIDYLMRDVQEPLEAIAAINNEEHQQKDDENDRRLNISLAVISVLTIFSAMIDLWNLLKEYIGTFSTDFANNKILFIVTVALIVIVLAVLIINGVFGYIFKVTVKNIKEIKKKMKRKNTKLKK